MKRAALCTVLMLAALPALAADPSTVIYLRQADALDLDPWQANDLYSNEVAANIFEGLVRFRKNDTAIEPCLATSWEIGDNGRSWRFSLRRGVRFHDGTPFDARAVVHSFQNRMAGRQPANQRMASLFAVIAGVRALAPELVEIRLQHPYAPFLTALADSAGFIQSPAPRAGDFVPVGTGPFRFVSWTRGRSLILVRHPGYWGGRPGVQRIVFKVMADPLGRVLQIRNGSADMAIIQSGKEYEELSRRSGISILSHPSVDTHYLGFNTRRPPFDRLEARLALRLVIPKGNLIKKIFQNLAQPAFTPLPPAIFPAQGPAPAGAPDLAAARSLLKAAGLADGFACSLYYPDGQQGVEELADLLAVMARQVRISVRKVKLPFSELVKAVDRGDHDLLMMGWSAGPDPDFFLSPLFTFEPGNRNRFFYENPELTRLLQQGRTTLDAPQRERIYRRALELLERDAPWIPLFHLIDNLATRSGVRGLSFTPLGHVIFRDITKESTP
ncbi:MAG TPA: ABC transporter substrate-binding protein [Candidatus Aminicenantes bacterium]|nr:ABC transporter substrate-binding protein [Candidatus Aminicenantes bacterium]